MMRRFIDITESAYKGEHEAPSKGDGCAPLYDLTAIYPKDIYTGTGGQYVTDDERNAFAIVLSYMGRPNRIMRIYRAVPKSLVRPKINAGDWVTIDRTYAREHGASNLLNDYKILSKQVFARDLYTEGNSLNEWGYDPQPFIPRDAENQIRLALGMQTVEDARAAHDARAAARRGG